MATTKKPTLKEQYEDLLTIPAVAENPDRVAFINGRLEQLAKKNATGGEKVLTEQQKANVIVKDIILAVLKHEGKPMTIGEILKADEGLSDVTNQRAAALLRQLILDHKVERTEVKRKAYFGAVATDEDEEGEE